MPVGLTKTTPALNPSLLASELRVVLGQLIRRLRSENRFSLSHASVLGRLDREGPQSVSDLATADRVRPQSMAQTLAELETAGLIDRRPDPGDRRSLQVELTEQGRERVLEGRGKREDWLAAAIAAELSLEEQRALLAAVPLLQRLTRR